MPSKIPPAAGVVLRRGTDNAEYQLTSVQARRFVGIVNNKAYEFEGGKVALLPYGSFIVEGRVYGWYPDFVALPVPERAGVWLRWDDPAFEKMGLQLSMDQYRLSDEGIRAALRELDSEKGDSKKRDSRKGTPDNNERHR